MCTTKYNTMDAFQKKLVLFSSYLEQYCVSPSLWQLAFHSAFECGCSEHTTHTSAFQWGWITNFPGNVVLVFTQMVKISLPNNSSKTKFRQIIFWCIYISTKKWLCHYWSLDLHPSVVSISITGRKCQTELCWERHFQLTQYVYRPGVVAHWVALTGSLVTAAS